MHKIFSIICHYSLENENFPLCIAMEISLSDAFECEKDRQFNCYKWPPEVAGMFKWKTEKLEKNLLNLENVRQYDELFPRYDILMTSILFSCMFLNPNIFFQLEF